MTGTSFGSGVRDGEEDGEAEGDKLGESVALIVCVKDDDFEAGRETDGEPLYTVE